MTFDDAATGLMVYVSGCPASLAASIMRDAAIEFCKKTQCLMSGSEVTFTSAAGVPEWNFGSDQIIDVIDAKRADGGEICILRLNDEAVDDLADDAYAIRFAEPNNLTITPAPTADLVVELVVIYAPGPESTTMHDSLWLRHHQALKHGALAKLYEIPKRSWTDITLAAYYGGKFEADIKDAKSEVNRNVTKPGRRLRVKPA